MGGHTPVLMPQNGQSMEILIEDAFVGQPPTS